MRSEAVSRQLEPIETKTPQPMQAGLSLAATYIPYVLMYPCTPQILWMWGRGKSVVICPIGIPLGCAIFSHGDPIGI